MGHGPGLILLHGGVNASQNLMKLGTLLRDEFTVYIPDRRGRGMSGPYGEDYSIRKEDEDLDAILKETGAHYVFGTADGALFALHAAISLSSIHKVAAYEPLVFCGQPGLDDFKATIEHFDQNMASGGVAKATVGLTWTTNNSYRSKSMIRCVFNYLSFTIAEFSTDHIEFQFITDFSLSF
ncbi:alpha/beta fold hydrolase [Methanobacterium subterraneum]|nr:alpha/beta hydrolase [Methanobacterium subterraneum]